MRHPFDRILPAPSETTDRRTLLQGAAGAAVLVAAGESLVVWGQEPGPDRPGARGVFFIIPKNVRRFGARRREALGINGDFTLLPEEDGKPRQGFLAWLTPEERTKIAEQDDVAEVLPLPRASVLGKVQERAPFRIVAVLYPNAWRQQPDKEDFQTVQQVIAELEKQLPAEAQAKFAPLGAEAIEVAFGENPDEKFVEKIRQHPQVGQLFWQAGPVRTAAANEAGATTYKLGEEGGPRATTQALGEEGNPPRATTRALGEEGNPPRFTTQALGEEGNPPRPTTKAIGEEGGPQPSTRALGEEGGRPQPTTLALGEEGGRQ